MEYSIKWNIQQLAQLNTISYTMEYTLTLCFQVYSKYNNVAIELTCISKKCHIWKAVVSTSTENFDNF